MSLPGLKPKNHAEWTEQRMYRCRRRFLFWRLRALQSRQSFRDKDGQVLRPNADDIHDTDVRQHAGGGPLVDGGGADAEKLRYLADGEELLDRR